MFKFLGLLPLLLVPVFAEETLGDFFPMAEGNRWVYQFEDYTFENASLPWMRSTTTQSQITVEMSDVATQGDTLFFTLQGTLETLRYSRLDVTGQREDFPENETQKARYQMFEHAGAFYILDGGGKWARLNPYTPYAGIFKDKFRFLVSPRLPRSLGANEGAPTDRFERNLVAGDSLIVYETRQEWESGLVGEYVLDYSRFGQGVGLIESYYRIGYSPGAAGGGDRRYSFQLVTFNGQVYNDSLYRQSPISMPKQLRKKLDERKTLGLGEFSRRFQVADYEVLNARGVAPQNLATGVYWVRARQSNQVRAYLVKD